MYCLNIMEYIHNQKIQYKITTITDSLIDRLSLGLIYENTGYLQGFLTCKCCYPLLPVVTP